MKGGTEMKYLLVITRDLPKQVVDLERVGIGEAESSRPRQERLNVALSLLGATHGTVGPHDRLDRARAEKNEIIKSMNDCCKLDSRGSILN